MDNDTLTDFTIELLKAQSHTPKTSKVPDILLAMLSRYGITAKVVEAHGIKNIVAQTSGPARVLFNGHWDTVLPGTAFHQDIQEITVVDGTIRGLGACDMKSGVAAMTAAFIACVQSNMKGVTLCLVGDEETGGQNGTAQLVKKGVLAPNVVLGEPTNGLISLGQKGGLEVRVTATGESAHGAYPHRGVNAITKLATFLSYMEETFPTPPKHTSDDTIFHQVTASANLIQGGTAANVIPSDCSAVIDVRIPPLHDAAVVRRVFNELTARIEGVEVGFEFFGNGWELDTTSDLYHVTAKAMRSVLGSAPRFVRKMGTNDGKYYADKACNIINAGPGDNTLSHTTQEIVSIQELQAYRDIYYAIAQNI